jgi:nucleoside-diphosphate kinase
MHPKQEKTLIIIKPDGVQRTLIGEIIKRIERVGLKLVGIKMIIPNSEIIKKHYLVDPEWLFKAGTKSLESYEKKGIKIDETDPVKIGEKILERLQKYMTSGPVIAMVWQGAHSVSVVRKIVGGTEPMSSDVGTIRGDLVLDSYSMSDFDTRSVRNLVHASGHVDEAEKEIDIWFKKDEMVEYRLIQEQILYDVNLDGILE